MAQMNSPAPNDKMVADAVFQLLADQNTLAKKTGDLLECVLHDVHRYKEQVERLVHLETKIESVHKNIQDFERMRNDCISECEQRFKELEKRREENKDKITELALVRANDLALIKDLMNEKIDRAKAELVVKYDATAKDVATIAGKYGGLVAVILSLLMMLLQWIITNTHYVKP